MLAKKLSVVAGIPSSASTILVDYMSEPYMFDKDDKDSSTYQVRMCFTESETLYVSSIIVNYKDKEGVKYDTPQTIISKKGIKVYPFIVTYKKIEKDILEAINKDIHIVDRYYLDVIAYTFKHDSEYYKEELGRYKDGNGHIHVMTATTYWDVDTKLYRQMDLVNLYLSGLTKDPNIKCFRIDACLSGFTINNFIKRTIIPYSKDSGDLINYYKDEEGRRIIFSTQPKDDEKTSWDVYSYPVIIKKELVSMLNDNYKTSKFYDLLVSGSLVNKVCNITLPIVRAENISTYIYTYVDGNLVKKKKDSNVINGEIKGKSIQINGYTINQQNSWCSPHRTAVNYNNPYCKVPKPITGLPNGKRIANEFAFGGHIDEYNESEIRQIIKYSFCDKDTTTLMFSGNTNSVTKRIAGLVDYLKEIKLNKSIYVDISPYNEFNKVDVGVILVTSYDRHITTKFKDFSDTATDAEAVQINLVDYYIESDLVSDTMLKVYLK